MKKKRFFKCFVGCCFAYLSIYGVNSFFGGYWPVPVAGRYVIESSVPLHTQFLWQPYLGYLDNYNSSFCGYIWRPAIVCDRLWIHKNLDLFKDGDYLGSPAGKAATRWNPVGMRKAREREVAEAVRIARIVKDPEFCLSEGGKGHRKDRHLIAVMLFDHYGTRAVEVLALKASSATNEFEGEAYNNINYELFAIEHRWATNLNAAGLDRIIPFKP